VQTVDSIAVRHPEEALIIEKKSSAERHAGNFYYRPSERTGELHLAQYNSTEKNGGIEIGEKFFSQFTDSDNEGVRFHFGRTAWVAD